MTTIKVNERYLVTDNCLTSTFKYSVGDLPMMEASLVLEQTNTGNIFQLNSYKKVRFDENYWILLSLLTNYKILFS